jgi:hypothetical protein
MRMRLVTPKLRLNLLLSSERNNKPKLMIFAACKKNTAPASWARLVAVLSVVQVS